MRTNEEMFAELDAFIDFLKDEIKTKRIRKIEVEEASK